MARHSIHDKFVYLLQTTSNGTNPEVHNKRCKYFDDVFKRYVSRQYIKEHNVSQTTEKHFWEILRDNSIAIYGKNNWLGVKRLTPLLDYYGIIYTVNYHPSLRYGYTGAEGGNELVIDVNQTLRNYKIKALKKKIRSGTNRW